MSDPEPSPLSVIHAAITEVGSTIRREVVRLVLAWMAAVAAVAIVLTIGISLAIAGVVRLSQALAHLCGRWLGQPDAGDALAGLLLVALPLVAVLILIRSACGRSPSP